MPKPPGSPDLTTTAFSIARQQTGPPFSQTLEAAELRRKLMLEIEWQKSQKPIAAPSAPTKPRPEATKRANQARRPKK